MMGIYIKGMEMPKNCFDCPCCNNENGYCNIRNEYVYGEVPRSCPLVPVPPHGRLVDADVLFDRMEFEIKHFVPTDEFSRGVLSGYRSAARASRYASTIIPASEEGE